MIDDQETKTRPQIEAFDANTRRLQALAETLRALTQDSVYRNTRETVAVLEAIHGIVAGRGGVSL